MKYTYAIMRVNLNEIERVFAFNFNKRKIKQGAARLNRSQKMYGTSRINYVAVKIEVI